MRTLSLNEIASVSGAVNNLTVKQFKNIYADTAVQEGLLSVVLLSGLSGIAASAITSFVGLSTVANPVGAVVGLAVAPFAFYNGYNNCDIWGV